MYYNPYEGVGAGKTIAKILATVEIAGVIKKPFHDVALCDHLKDVRR